MESNPIFPSLLALKTAHKQLLSQRREGIDDSFLAEVEAFIQRGCVTGVTLDGDDERWEVQNLLDYWANELLHNKRIAPEATLAEYDPEQAPELPDELCPYRGLDAFDASQKAYFFGRGALVREMMKRLKNGRFLAIVGPSGSGKSSTALAGLLPSLQAGKLANSDSWHIFPAFVPGAAPLDALVRALQPAQQTDSQQNQYLEDPQTLATQLNQHPASLLLIDQFEELYTLCYDPTQRDAFIHNLLGVLQQPENPHTIIITMRSDLEAKLTHIAKFQTLFTDNQVRLSPMNASDLRDTIEKPARLVGLKFEDDVVDALIRDVLGEPAALPLLQFSLLKLWEAREKNRITWAAYRQLGSGRNALANVADTLYNDLPTDEQPSTRHLFLQLVRFGKGLEVSRDRVLRQQLVQSLGNKTAVSHILDQFIQARLIRQAPTATHNNDTIELAHEALLTHWPKFIGWIEEARITQRNRIQFTNMAAQWAELEQDASVLLRGRLLAAAQQFDDCDEIEKAFIAASIQAVDEEAFGKEQARRERLHQAEALAEERQKRLDEKDKLTQRLGRTLVALIALAVFALVAWGVAMRSADAAEQSRATAVASEATALANQTIADTLRETAVANANDLATAEANALRERDQAATNERLAQQAQATVEASFIEVNDARAAAVDSADEAEIQFREATARELAAAAVNQLNSNPQLSLYLALESIYFPLAAGQTPPEESANVLYRALQAAQLQRTFSGHTDWISDIAISPDSLQVATSGYDNSVRIWDRTSGQEQHLIEKHVGAVNTVAFNYSGTQLATGGDDGFVYIWRTSDFELVATLIATLEDEENGRVTAVSFHPDNQRIAVAYDDSSVRVWDIPSLQSQMRLFGHSAPINDVVFNQLGDQFATAGADGLTIVRETATGATLYPILENPPSEPANSVNGVVFSPNGLQIVTANDDGVARIWQDQQIINTLPGHTSFLFDVAYSDDGTLIATASGDGTARIWQADTGQVISSITGHTGGVTAVQFTPSGQQLLTASQDNSARLWNSTPGIAPLVMSDHTAPVLSVAYNSDGSLIATGSEDRTAVIWDVSNGLAIQTFAGHNSAVNDVVFSPDNSTLATASEDANVRLWHIGTGDVQFLIHSEAVTSLDYQADGTHLASGSQDGLVRIWDVETRTIVQQFPHEAPVLDVAFHPHGQLVAASDDAGQIRIWNRTTEAIKTEFEQQDGAVQAVAFSADGAMIATAGHDGTARIWTVEGTLLRVIPGHNSAIWGIAFHPDGSQLATTGADRAVRLWDVETGQALYSISGQTAAVTAVTFSPDGTHIATAGIDRTAQINVLNSISDLFEQAWNQIETPIDQAICDQYLHGETCITLTIDQPLPPLNLPPNQ